MHRVLCPRGAMHICNTSTSRTAYRYRCKVLILILTSIVETTDVVRSYDGRGTSQAEKNSLEGTRALLLYTSSTSRFSNRVRPVFRRLVLGVGTLEPSSCENTPKQTLLRRATGGTERW